MAKGPKRTLRDNLVSLIESTTGIHEIKNRPTLEFSGWPSGFVVPAGNEADYMGNTENSRQYVFLVWIFNEIDTGTMEENWNDLMDIADEVMAKIDEQDSPESDRELATGLTAPYTLLAVRATPAEEVPDEKEKMIGTKIIVRCHVAVDIDQL